VTCSGSAGQLAQGSVKISRKCPGLVKAVTEGQYIEFGFGLFPNPEAWEAPALEFNSRGGFRSGEGSTPVAALRIGGGTVH